MPLPASGRTAERWQRLAQLAQDDIVAARIAEAHVDAIAILHELGGKPPESGQLWGVWAAESPDAVLTATDITATLTLDGHESVVLGRRVLHQRAGDRPASETAANGGCSP